jgi:hypothetical protein
MSYERFHDMFKIQVKTIHGPVITFTVDTYVIEDGDFVSFTDRVTREKKLFHSSNCEIKEVDLSGGGAK